MESSLGKRDKFDRVADMIGWGMNAPAYLKVFEDPYFNISLLAERNRWNQVSVRSLHSTGRSGVALINMDPKTIRLANHRLEEFLPLMITEGRPIADISGCILVNGENFIVEYAYDVPVRHVTWSKVIPLKIKSNFPSLNWRGLDTRMVSALEEVQLVPYEKYIVEFSLFPFRSGPFKQHTIFWEYEETDGYSPC